jgi:hypothetical protein
MMCDVDDVHGSVVRPIPVGWFLGHISSQSTTNSWKE